MGRPTIKLGPPEKLEEIEKRYREEKDVRKRSRLLCLKLAAEGKYSAQEIGCISGCSRTSVFGWVKAYRKRGVEEVLQRGKPGPRPGEMKGISSEVGEEMKEGVEKGRWATAVALVQWLQREHQIKKPYTTVWQWIKKWEGCCECHGPDTPNKTPKRQKHSKKN